MNKGMLLLVLPVCFIVLNAFAVLSLKPVDNDNAVTFTIKNFGINTKGELRGLNGNIVWNEENTAASTFTVSVDVNTINTGIDARDNHLKKEEYFNVAKFPQLNFTSTAIAGSNNAYNATGNLTIKGITKTVSFPFTAVKASDGYTFNGNFAIHRKDFGVGGNSMVLGDDVNVSLKVTAKAE